MHLPFLDTEIFRWLVLPLLIFVARIMDVTIGTLRIIFVAKGKKWLAPVCGFFEVIIWLVAIGQVMQHLNNVACYLAYGAGFAAGTFVGISIEERLAVGTLVVHIVTAREASRLSEALAAANYGVTRVEGRGANGPVTMIYTVIKRKDLPMVAAMIRDFDPKAFYAVEEVRKANEGIFPAARQAGKSRLNRSLGDWPFLDARRSRINRRGGGGHGTFLIDVHLGQGRSRLRPYVRLAAWRAAWLKSRLRPLAGSSRRQAVRHREVGCGGPEAKPLTGT